LIKSTFSHQVHRFLSLQAGFASMVSAKDAAAAPEPDADESMTGTAVTWNGWYVSSVFCFASLAAFPPLLGLLILLVRTDPAAAELGGESLPTEYWRLVQMAFMTCLLMDFVSYLFTVDKGKSRLFYFVLVINGLPVVSYGLLASGVSPILVDAHGRRFIAMRYVVWLLTTPAMLYLYSIVSYIPKRELAIAMVLEYVVIVTGVLASLLPSFYGLFFLAVRMPSLHSR
jgi:hypothetical protein